MKDLVDMDFDEEPIAIKDLPLHEATTIGNMTALDTMFRKFIVAKSHLIPVEKDDKYIGIITIEDLVEEILGHEISDETDIIKHRTQIDIILKKRYNMSVHRYYAATALMDQLIS